MDWSQDDDPHGVQKLLALLRTQQDKTLTASKGQITTTSQEGTLPIQQPGSSANVVTTAKEDVRYISFAQALPHLTTLSKDEAFLSALLKLKAEQDQFEEKLADEREAFSKKKGSDPSSMSALTSWDREALRRWDSLHQEHQKRLQAWGVPCFFETREPANLKKQERVFDVLYGLLE